MAPVKHWALGLGLVCLGAASAMAADNMDKLQNFQTTGTDLEIATVPQGGTYADALRNNLSKVKLPAGFKIDLYAIVPDARHMAVGTNVGVVFTGTRKTKVWAVTDRDRDRVADEVKEFSPSLKFAVPNGLCFSKDGFSLSRRTQSRAGLSRCGIFL